MKVNLFIIIILLKCIFAFGIPNRPQCVDSNEVYRCGHSCSEQCSDTSCVDAGDCVMGCYCRSGFLRNEAGTCVPSNECFISTDPGPVMEPVCCGEHEEYSCNYPCSCEQLALFGCPDYMDCQWGCNCESGYYRNSDGICVRDWQCEACPGVNEQYYCTSPCSCDEVVNSACPQYFQCVEGCNCAPGYYRNDNGVCVKEEECHVCPENEVYSLCGSPCEEQCDHLLHGGQCPYYFMCPRGCFCKEGYYRNSEGTCVPKCECNHSCHPETMHCPRNEVFRICGNDCTDSCQSHLGLQQFCTLECYSGCFCMNGFSRNSDGECVPQDECCPEGEEFSDFGNYCTDSCDIFHHPGKQCPVYGMKGCFCPDGQYRDCSGSCVKKEYCCPANEEYLKCGYECDDSCAGYLSLRPCPRMHCQEGCYCQEGYYRNVHGVCVREEQCYPEYERWFLPLPPSGPPHHNTVIVT